MKNPDIKNLPPGEQNLRIMLQTKGRKGKKVTLIQGLQHDYETLLQLSRELKQFCSTGGTVKDRKLKFKEISEN